MDTGNIVTERCDIPRVCDSNWRKPVKENPAVPPTKIISNLPSAHLTYLGTISDSTEWTRPTAH
jgi:hypothetical protein